MENRNYLWFPLKPCLFSLVRLFSVLFPHPVATHFSVDRAKPPQFLASPKKNISSLKVFPLDDVHIQDIIWASSYVLYLSEWHYYEFLAQR